MSVTEITDTRQYLTFKLGDEVFATDVCQGAGGARFHHHHQDPRTPDFMSGVINLRGNVVPVVDLRLCFEMSQDGEDGQHLHRGGGDVARRRIDGRSAPWPIRWRK